MSARRVLDRLLGAMLGVVMQQPGLSLAKLSQKFSPAIQPAHCRHLVIILTQLRSVQYSTVQYSTVQYSTVQYSTVL